MTEFFLRQYFSNLYCLISPKNPKKKKKNVIILPHYTNHVPATKSRYFFYTSYPCMSQVFYSLSKIKKYSTSKLYGTEVPRPTEVPKSKLGLDLRPGLDPECGTKMPKCELGLGLKISSTAPYLISLLYTALVSYKSESRSLTNARRDFPKQ